MNKLKDKFRLNLQLFADGEEGEQAPEQQQDNDAGTGDETPPEEEDKPEKKYTDEEVNTIVKRKIAEEKSKAEKAVKEAEKLAKMNEEQKKEYELEQLKAKIAELEAKENKNEMIKIARGMLTEEDINASDELLAFLVTEEAESTKVNVDSFKAEFKSAVDKAVTEKLKGKTPRASGGASTASTDGRKLTEMSYEEQVELQRTNPELYSKKLNEI